MWKPGSWLLTSCTHFMRIYCYNKCAKILRINPYSMQFFCRVNIVYFLGYSAKKKNNPCLLSQHDKELNLSGRPWLTFLDIFAIRWQLQWLPWWIWSYFFEALSLLFEQQLLCINSFIKGVCFKSPAWISLFWMPVVPLAVWHSILFFFLQSSSDSLSLSFITNFFDSLG